MSDIILEMKNLTCEMNGISMLDDVSFQLEQGDNLVIFGTENAGLSVITSIILAFQKSYTGDVLYKGNPIRNFDYIKIHDYKREIGYVHGEYGLMSNMTVEGNISLPLEYHSKLSTAEIKKTVDRLIFELNLDHCKRSRPFELTRSELLRTSFGMSVVLDPDLLVIEHAFESQCPLNVLSLLDNIIARMQIQKKSVIIITYYPEKFVDFSERFLMLFNGRAVFYGDRREFIESDNPYLVQYKNVSSTGPMPIL